MGCDFRIGLLGPYGTGNLGDAAIQDALIHQVRQFAPAAQCVGISLDPRDTELRHGIPAFPIDVNSAMKSRHPVDRPARVKRPVRIRRALQRALAPLIGLSRQVAFTARSWSFARTLDVLAVSGGGQIDDYWGGAWEHPFSLLRWTIVARLCGCRVMFLCVGGWELRSWLSRLFMRWALGLAHYRSYRDPVTRRFVESLGVSPPHHEFPDLAFSYPIRTAAQAVPGRRSDRLVIGICPIAAMAWTTAENPEHARYLDGIAAFAARMIERGHDVRLFPSQINMDAPVVARLLERIVASHGPAGAQSVSAVAVESVGDFVAAAQQVDIVVASRLHGALLSLVAATPVIATFHHRKVSVLMEQLGLLRYCVNLQDSGDGALDACLDDLVGHRDEVMAGIQKRLVEFCDALQRQAAVLFLGSGLNDQFALRPDASKNMPVSTKEIDADLHGKPQAPHRVNA